MSAISVVRSRLDDEVAAAPVRFVPDGVPTSGRRDCLVVQAEGELDLSVLESFRRALAVAVDSGSPTVIVDLRRARFLSLRNASVLAETVELAGRREIDLRVLTSRREIERVLTLMGLRTTDYRAAVRIT